MQGLGPLTSLGYMPWYFQGLAPSGGNGGALASKEGFKKIHVCRDYRKTS